MTLIKTQGFQECVACCRLLFTRPLEHILTKYVTSPERPHRQITSPALRLMYQKMRTRYVTELPSPASHYKTLAIDEDLHPVLDAILISRILSCSADLSTSSSMSLRLHPSGSITTASARSGVPLSFQKYYTRHWVSCDLKTNNWSLLSSVSRV